MWAHQFTRAPHASGRLGLDRFATMQNHYNLLYREEEREVPPLCAREDIGVIPWSPLARGYLARPHEQFDPTTRGESDDYARACQYFERTGRGITERVAELADESDASMAQIALVWLLHQDPLDAPIVDTTSAEHLEEASPRWTSRCRRAIRNGWRSRTNPSPSAAASNYFDQAGVRVITVYMSALAPDQGRGQEQLRDTEWVVLWSGCGVMTPDEPHRDSAVAECDIETESRQSRALGVSCRHSVRGGVGPPAGQSRPVFWSFIRSSVSRVSPSLNFW
jgi:hypothetical protein